MYKLRTETLQIIKERGIFTAIHFLPKHCKEDKITLESAKDRYIKETKDVINCKKELKHCGLHYHDSDCGKNDCMYCLVFRRNWNFWYNKKEYKKPRILTV